ncbi:MAG: phage holin family protein [Bacteroidota bacterium]
MEDNHFENLIDHTKEYVSTRIEIVKLQAVDKTSRLGGILASYVIFFIAVVIVFLFISIGAAYLIGKELGGTDRGFFAVGGAYAIIGMLFYFNRERWVKRPFANSILRSLLNESDHD